MKIKHKSPFGGTYRLFESLGKYPNGQTSIRLYDEEDGLPYATATVSVKDQLEEDEVAIKNYSENEGLLQSLINSKIIDSPHRFIESGFVKIPVCKLKIKNS
jgi:hypothetical protein